MDQQGALDLGNKFEAQRSGFKFERRGNRVRVVFARGRRPGAETEQTAFAPTRSS